MSMKDDLGLNVEPLLRDYIDAAIQEALAPLLAQMRLDRLAYENLVLETRKTLAARPQ